MPQLAQAYETFEKPGLVVSYKITNAKIWKGSLVGLNASGYLVSMDPGVAGLRFVGVANETIDNAAGASGDRSVGVTKCGAFVLKAAAGFAPALADLGKEVYAASNWEAQTSATGLTNAYRVGTIVALDTTSTGVSGVRVRVDNYTA